MEKEEMVLEMLKYAPIFLKGSARCIYEITQGEEAMLIRLRESGGESSPTALSLALGLSTARVASTLNTLEKKGYIKRRHDENDRRRIIVSITDEGAEYSNQRRQNAIFGIRLMMEQLGERDSQDLLRVMRHLYELARAWEETSCGQTSAPCVEELTPDIQ